ncbi:hypothetical protein HYW20_05155 [Candidatus Woesearchaeota archaeon]|nr:hypothetical protein [Candidatus Woesearchaeota archaeon]
MVVTFSKNKMAGNKTSDGISISAIVKLLGQLPGVSIRQGSNHPFIAVKDGMRPCPIATSTNAKIMLVPWVAEATGYDRKAIYSSFRSGGWYQ